MEGRREERVGEREESGDVRGDKAREGVGDVPAAGSCYLAAPTDARRVLKAWKVSTPFGGCACK